MDKTQYDLCAEVLNRLSREGVLEHVVVIGSWCMLSYKDYFRSVEYYPAVRTRDIDILVPVPPSFRQSVDVERMLRDLDFVISFRGKEGHISFVHRDLSLEFLVPERWRGSDKPYPLPALGTNAQRLRYLDFLLQETIWGRLGDVRVRLPHPARFALHKLIVSTCQRRTAKRENDLRQGVYILERLTAMGRVDAIRAASNHMPSRWRKLVWQVLSEEPTGEVVLRVIVE